MIFSPKSLAARNWVIRNLRRIQFAIQEEQLYAECGARWKKFYLSHLLCICPSLFETYLNEANYIIYEIKPPTPVLLTVHFSAALKALVLGNLFKVFRLDITFAREVCHLGIKMKKIWQSSYSFHYPQWQTARANVMANLTSLDKLPNIWAFVAAQNGSLEVLELVALFLLKTGTFGTKNW